MKTYNFITKKRKMKANDKRELLETQNFIPYGIAYIFIYVQATTKFKDHEHFFSEYVYSI